MIQPLGGAYALSPARKTQAGYAKVDSTLAGISEQAQRLPRAQMLDSLEASTPQVHFSVADPRIVPGVLVDILVKGDPAQVESQLRQLDVQHISVFSNLISGFLPVDRIKDAATLENVKFIRASRARAHTGSITTQGDFVQHSDLLRASTVVPGLNGSGITVGVLSDSFACTSKVKSEAQDIATGDLPKDTQVLAEISDCTSGADEGRGMAQLVYDVAPGSKIMFYTAFNGEADFANGILALQAAGAQVITDDVGYFDEPTYQDGVVAQAIDQVKAKGVAYFSSAGNSARQAFEAKFVDSGTVGAAGADNAGEKLMSFTSADGKTTQNFLPISLPTGFREQSLQILQWDQPYTTGAPGSPGNSSSLDICLTDSTGTVIPGGFCSGATPVGTDSVAITGLVTDGVTGAFGVQVGVVGGTPPPANIKIIFADDGGGSQADAAFATYSPTIQGHPGAAGANAVGASYFRANPVCLPAAYPNYTVENYSSAGGDPILFDTSGKAITPVTRQKPNFVAPDGGNTTFFAQILGGRGDPILQCENAPGTWNFFGTSAAAPHAAGVAALLMQAQPKSTPDLIRQALQSTTIVNMAAIDPATGAPVPQTAVNFDTGYGFIQADAALAQVLPGVSLSATALNFGNEGVTSTSAAQTVILTNSGGFPTTISSIAATGDFVASNTCPIAPATLAPTATCSISVTATPTVSGSRSGSVTITSDAKSSPNAISLNVIGVPPQISLSTTALNFGDEGVTSTSAAQAVILTNSGGFPASISSIVATGDFAASNTCPTAPVKLAPAATCTISVTATPTFVGSRSGSVTITSDAKSSPDAISLSVNGVPPQISLSAKTLSFGNQLVATKSAVQSITVSNSGAFPASIGSIVAAGDFAASNNCPTAPTKLAPAATCAINVTATPTVAGARSGSVTITSDAGSSPDEVDLSVNGVQPQALLTPKSLVFGSITQGSSTSKQILSQAQIVTLTNVGTSPLNISGISTADPAFVQTNNCPAALAASSSCTITVNFSPSDAKKYSSTMTLASDSVAAGDSQVALSGTGVAGGSGGAFAPILLLPGFAVFLLRRRKRNS